MAKVGALIKTAKFAGKILGGVATAAGIYEGAKIVGNGITSGLDAMRARNQGQPPPPNPSPETVAGYDYDATGVGPEDWTGANPIAQMKVGKRRTGRDLSVSPVTVEEVQGYIAKTLEKNAELKGQCEAIKAQIATALQSGASPFQVASLGAKLKECEKLLAVNYSQLNYLKKQLQSLLDGSTSGAASDAYEEMTSAGPDEWWTAGAESPLLSQARSIVGAAESFEEVGGSYDCSDAARQGNIQRVIERGYSREYAVARVEAVRDYAGCNGPQAEEEMRAAVQQLISEGVDSRQATRAVVTSALRLRLQGQGPASYSPAPAPAPAAKLPPKPQAPAQAPTSLAALTSSLQGPDEYWNVGAGPSYVRKKGQSVDQAAEAQASAAAPGGSKKLRELEDKLTILNFELTTLQNEAREALKNYQAAEADWQKGVRSGVPIPGKKIKADKTKTESQEKSRQVQSKQKEIETQKSLVTAERESIRLKTEADKAKAKGDAAKAAADLKASVAAKQLAKVTEELNKKVADSEAALKQAKSDGEKAVLEAKISALQDQASNMAKLAAAPKEVEKVAQAPSETGAIISSLLQAVLQKNANPQEIAVKVEQGQTPVPSENPMEYREMDDLYVADDEEGVSGAEPCCEACARGLSCEGGSCSVSSLPKKTGGHGHAHGHDHDHGHGSDIVAGTDVPAWTMHWANPFAPAWADGIFEGGPGIPSHVSNSSCSTGSCRLPK